MGKRTGRSNRMGASSSAMPVVVMQLLALAESKSPGLQVTWHFIFFFFFPIRTAEAERVERRLGEGHCQLLFCHMAALFLSVSYESVTVWRRNRTLDAWTDLFFLEQNTLALLILKAK